MPRKLLSQPKSRYRQGVRPSSFKWLGPLALGLMALTLVATEAFAKPKKKKPSTEQTEAAPSGTHNATSPSARPRRHHRATPAITEASPQRPGRHVAHGNSPTQPVREGALPPPVVGAVCPAEMANVDDRFCIDRWEGSLVEVLHDGRELPWPPFGAVEPGHSLRAVSVPNVYPQAYISGAQAARACAASGKRLCAPVEWRKACMGPKQTTFGYGTDRVAGPLQRRGRQPDAAPLPAGVPVVDAGRA